MPIARRHEVRARRVLHHGLDRTTAPFFDALEAAVKRGITVRVLLDHLASRRSPGYFRTIRQLKKIGVQWHLMLPVQPLRGRFQRPDLRNHRKILVVDGDARLHRVAEHHRLQLQQVVQPPTRAALERPDGAVRGPDRGRASTRCSSPTGTARPTSCCCARPTPCRGRRRGTRSAPRWCRAAPDSTARTTCACSTRCSTPRRSASSSQSLLRARRIHALRHHDGGAERPRRSAVRLGGGRPARRLPRAAQLLRGAAARRRADLAVPEARPCCTPSTSPSTTRSRSSAPATWTCARSVSTSRSRSWCAASRSSRRCAAWRTPTAPPAGS